MVKLLFLGVDGGTWDVVEPLMAAGKLPNFARVVEEGTHGRLRSTDPPVTYPAWRVLSSGKHPGKLGVYAWNHPDFGKRKFVYPNSTDYRTRDVWDYANAAGFTTAVVNQPGTTPPFDVSGVFIAGPESQGQDLVRPASRADIVARYARHSHGLATFVRRGDLPRVLAVVRNGFEVAASLAPEVDVLHHVVFLTDTVQHHLWHDADAMRATWTEVDRGLGLLLERARPERVIIASDHGFQRLDHLVSVNAALAQRGLATLVPPKGAGALGRLGLDRARILRLARRCGIPESSLSKLPNWLKDRVPEATGGLGTRREHAIVWDRTDALTGDGRGVYLRDPARIDDVREALATLSDATGEAFFASVRPRAEVWQGPYLASAPDLFITPRDGVEPGGGVGNALVRAPVPGTTWVAHHHPEGIFVAWGEGVRAGEMRGASIVDVMPTMLAALGTPIPTDVDGKILDVFASRRNLETREPLPLPGEGQAYSPEEEARIQRHLEDLGYI